MRTVKVCHLLDNVRPGVGVTQVVHDLMTDPEVAAQALLFSTPAIDPRFAALASTGALTIVQSRSGLVEGVIAARLAGYRILHVHSRKFTGTCILARLLGMGVIRTQHFGIWQRSGRRVLAGLRNRLTLDTWWISTWVAISDTSRTYVTRRWNIPDHRIALIHNGVDIDRFVPPIAAARRLARTSLGWQDDWTVVVSVGSLVPRKRHAQTIAAFAALAADRPDLRLAIAGEGSERTALQAQIRELGLSGRVFLLGLREDVPALLQASNIFVHAAQDEAFGLVVAEALACGLPAIVCAGTGPAEIVDHGGTGFVVPASGTDPLVDAMSRLSKNSYLRARMAEAGRLKVEQNFSVRAMRSAYRAIYAAMAGSSRD